MAKRTIYAGVSAVGRSTWRDPEMPIHVSGSALDVERNPAGVRGKSVAIEMNEAVARWVGLALLRYGSVPKETLGDMSADHFFTKAFDEELKAGLERAIAAGNAAANEHRERIAASKARQAAERATVIEDRTDRGFDPEAYGDDHPNGPIVTDERDEREMDAGR